MWQKTLKIFQNIFVYSFAYIWYFAIYLVIIPYLVLIVGKNLDILLFDYILNLSLGYSNLYLIVSIVLATIGIILILWSFVTLYFYSHSFPLSFFPFPGFNPKRLSTYGPYSLVRHPMVLGYLILITAIGFYNGSLMTVVWIVPILGFVFYEYIKNREERRLSLWFGKEYDEYRKKTPILLPKILKK